MSPPPPLPSPLPLASGSIETCASSASSLPSGLPAISLQSCGEKANSLPNPDSCPTTIWAASTPYIVVTFAMTSHPLPTIRGPYQHYTTEHFDWQSLFTEYEERQPTPSLRAFAKEHSVQSRTFTRHYNNYKAAQRSKDSVALRVALGEIDGRRDNARVFSRAEEEVLRTRLLKENAHPNKASVMAAAINIHEAETSKENPAFSTRGQKRSATHFHAGGSFVQRVKRDLSFNDHKPKVVKKYKKKQMQTPELRRDEAAIFWDEVEEAVKKCGGHWTINADEVSAKLLHHPPHAVA